MARFALDVHAGEYTPGGCRSAAVVLSAGLQSVHGSAQLVRVGLGGGQLVLQSNDRLGRGQGVTVVEQAPDAGGEQELLAGVAAVTAGGAVRLQHPRAVEAAEEGGLHP